MNIDYATVFSLAPFISENIITIIGICLLIGAMAKSSQFGQVKALKKIMIGSIRLKKNKYLVPLAPSPANQLSHLTHPF